MATKKFTIGDALRFGWDNFKGNMGIFIGLILIIGLITFLISFIENNIDSYFLKFIIGLVRFVVMTFLGLGFLKITLKVYDKKSFAIGDLFSCSSVFLNGLIASILYAIMTGIGFLLLIIPGVILGIMFQFWGYFIVESNLGPIEAFKKSKEITTGYKMDLFLLAIIFLFLNMLGGIFFLIGLLITVPITILAYAYIFRKLTSDEEIPQDTGSVTETTEEAPETA